MLIYAIGYDISYFLSGISQVLNSPKTHPHIFLFDWGLLMIRILSAESIGRLKNIQNQWFEEVWGLGG